MESLTDFVLALFPRLTLTQAIVCSLVGSIVLTYGLVFWLLRNLVKSDREDG